MSAALAKAAREVHDGEEFLAHIGNIADRHRREHELETGSRGREVRRALKVFRRHAEGLSAWLETARGKPASFESEALHKLGTAMQSVPNQSFASSSTIATWLQQAETAAAAAEAELANKKAMNASRIAAEALRATFEHHGLKWSTQVTKQSAGTAVRLLCAIAKNSGEELEPEQARAVLIAATRPAAR